MSSEPELDHSCLLAVNHVNLRPEAPQKAEALTFSEGIFNNTITQFVQQELIMPKAAPTGAKVDKLIYVLITMFFGCCGCDRCFMGQCCLGTLKGLTFGGLFIWHLIDYFVCVYCALTKEEKLDMVGYDVTFKESSIQGAFIACLVIFLFNCLSTGPCQIKSTFANHATQQSEQAQFDIVFQQLMAAQAANANQAAQQSASPSPELSRHRSVPIIEQPLGYLPTPFAKALRQAGVINKDPSTPELLAAFKAMDKDGDGKLDRDELKQALSSMGVTEADVDTMIKEADKDGDKKISKDEFLQYHAKKAIEKAAKKAKGQV